MGDDAFLHGVGGYYLREISSLDLWTLLLSPETALARALNLMSCPLIGLLPGGNPDQGRQRLREGLN
jgi:hypothetical protein